MFCQLWLVEKKLSKRGHYLQKECGDEITYADLNLSPIQAYQYLTSIHMCQLFVFYLYLDSKNTTKYLTTMYLHLK